MSKVLLLGIFFCLCMVLILAKLNGKYSNKWVANIEGGEEVAKSVARDLGYTYKGQFGEFKDYYELIREDHPGVSERHSGHLTNSLLDIDEVKWAKQQIFVKRVPTGSSSVSEESQQEKLYSFFRKAAKEAQSKFAKGSKAFFSRIRLPSKLQKLLYSLNQGDVSKLGSFSTDPAPESQLSTYEGTTKNIGLKSKKLSAYAVTYNDPKWRFQWYMQDYRTTKVPVMDLNVVPVHKTKFAA